MAALKIGKQSKSHSKLASSNVKYTRVSGNGLKYEKNKEKNHRYGWLVSWESVNNVSFSSTVAVLYLWPLTFVCVCVRGFQSRTSRWLLFYLIMVSKGTHFCIHKKKNTRYPTHTHRQTCTQTHPCLVNLTPHAHTHTHTQKAVLSDITLAHTVFMDVHGVQGRKFLSYEETSGIFYLLHLFIKMPAHAFGMGGETLLSSRTTLEQSNIVTSVHENYLTVTCMNLNCTNCDPSD